MSNVKVKEDNLMENSHEYLEVTEHASYASSAASQLLIHSSSHIQDSNLNGNYQETQSAM